MKRKVMPALIAIVLILLIVAGAAGAYLYDRYSYSKEQADPDAYFGLGASNEAAIVLNKEHREEKGLLKEGHCYLDLETVHAYLNERFYVDYQEKLLLYALPDRVVRIELGAACEDGYVAAFEEAGKIYLAVDYVKKYSDFNFTLYTEPDRLLLQTVWEEELTAEVKKNTAIRLKGGVKSEILTQAAKGDRLVVLEQMETWSKVMSADGYIGYVENKRLLEAVAETPVKDTGYVEPDYSGNVRDHKINMAWHQVTTEAANATFPGVVDGVIGLNVISPTWFFLYDNNGVIESIASKEYVDQAHARGLEVWALMDDFTYRAENGVDTEQILSYTSKRTMIIESLMSEAERCGFDGINLDFEMVKDETGQDYIQFIRELSIACRQRGLVLSVDNYVPKHFNAHYEWEEQGVMADYVIIMGYDEHWGGSEVAGSVASIGYVEEGIRTMTGMVPANKVINAVPLYTRIWLTAADGKVTSQAVGIQKASDYLTRNGVAYEWDDETGQNYAEFDTQDGRVQVWLEDEASLAAKVSLMKHYGLGGISAWKLGFDDGRENIWSVIAGMLAE